MKRFLRNKDVLIITIAIILLMFWIGIISLIVNFYKDWKCNNTDNPEWFVENQCVRYVK